MKHRPCGNGKGDTPRPIKDREKFDNNWDSIFKKKKLPNLVWTDDQDPNSFDVKEKKNDA